MCVTICLLVSYSNALWLQHSVLPSLNETFFLVFFPHAYPLSGSFAFRDSDNRDGRENPRKYSDQISNLIVYVEKIFANFHFP